MRKVMLGAVVMLASAMAAGTADAPTRQSGTSDPVVSTLNQLVDSLSSLDSTTDADVNGSYANNPADRDKARSHKKSTVIIGTAAAIGSAVGAMVAKEDRAKGAAIGAAVGGIAGLIYDRMTANKQPANSAPAPPNPPASTPQPAREPN